MSGSDIKMKIVARRKNGTMAGGYVSYCSAYNHSEPSSMDFLNYSRGAILRAAASDAEVNGPSAISYKILIGESETKFEDLDEALRFVEEALRRRLEATQ